MKDIDIIYDIFAFIVFVSILFLISAAVNIVTSNSVEAQVKDDVRHMRSQELGISFMRNYFPAYDDMTWFETLSTWHSLEEGESIQIAGEEFRRESSGSYYDYYQDPINNYRDAAPRDVNIIDNLYVQGFDGGSDNYGVVFPVPDAQGEISVVKVWGEESQ